MVGISAGVSLAATSGGSAASPQPAPVRLTQHRADKPPHAAAAQPKPGGATGRQAAPRKQAAATSRAAGRPSARAAARPYLIYDSVIPTLIPAGRPVATYADGPHATPLADVAGRGQVLWIDIEGTDTAAAAIDVEPGCASPLAAANWARAKLAADPAAKAIIYTSISEWSAVQADVAALPAWMQQRIRWWIADPTGYPHVVPGSQATQWYWGSRYDISTALPGF